MRALSRLVKYGCWRAKERMTSDRVGTPVRDVVLQQAFAVLRKCRTVKHRLDKIDTQEPAIQELIHQLRTKGAFAADRIQAHQQRSLQQPLGRNRRSTIVDVHRVKKQATAPQALHRRW